MPAWTASEMERNARAMAAATRADRRRRVGRTMFLTTSSCGWEFLRVRRGVGGRASRDGTPPARIRIARHRGNSRQRSDVQGLEIRDALLRKLPALLDEVVLDSPGLRGGEGLHPVDGALA